MTAEEAVRSEHQRQGVTQVSVANAITSLRLCSEIDWREFVERVSLVEHALRRDPAGVYGRMDFLSRDEQRHAVEQIAAPNGEAQVHVGAAGDRERASGRRARIDDATARRTSAITWSAPAAASSRLTSAYRPPLGTRIRRLALRHPTLLYLGADRRRHGRAARPGPRPTRIADSAPPARSRSRS